MAPDRATPTAPRRGSITLVALCLTTALGIALGSYLALCHRSNQFSARSLQLEKARELAQVGLEEALWALNNDTWTGSGPGSATPWTPNGTNRTVTLTYPLTSQGATGSVVLTVTNVTIPPATSQPWPTITAAATLTLASGETFTKTLQATTSPAPLFANAVASSESYVSFVGGKIDSWASDPDEDSATPRAAYSFTAGKASNYAAVVAGNTDGTYGVRLGNAELCGYVATTGLPITYSTSASPSPKILGPTTPAGTNIDSARIGKSAFVPSPAISPVSVPTVSGGTLNILQLVLALLAAILDVVLDLFKTNGLVIDGTVLNPSIVVRSPTQLVVNGDLTIKSGLLGATGSITITNTGSLELFVSGDITIEGDGFENLTNDPSKLAIYSTNSSPNNSITYDTPASFCGVIYSENSPIELKRNGPYVGALLSRNSVRFTSAAPVVHYDTALRLTRFSGVKTPYVTRQVTEL